MHGGTLEGRSAGPGQGSEFLLRLPLAEGVQPPVPVPLPSDHRGLDLIRVLVVDDNHDAGDSLGEVLSHLGAEVRLARSGVEALQIVAEFRPRVVLLDIGMPGMDGYEVARAVRAGSPQPQPVLVALTGWGQEGDRARARDAGFDHHLVKPAEMRHLENLLGTVNARPATE
jgi:CheY-like chemotaxis protein